MSMLLSISGLQSFYGVSQALYGLDLEVRRGEQIALIGRNGMGKTTLMKSIMGFIADRRGEILLAGSSTLRSAPEDIARAGVAYVPEGRGVFGSLSVVENLTMSARAGISGQRRWTLDRVFEVFPRLHQRRMNGGHQLSGGEQQMLSIGRALMTNPDLILLDEATEGLAPLIAQEIWKTLGIIRNEGIATIVVDKDHRSLAKVADRMVIMAKGEIVFDDAPAALAARPEILEKHLGV
ncbi:MAG: ABC transporter ATP-binding protein [Methylobacterium sp.]|jgi:branched-chain amino acid transport system ATP-binding protein|nr:ABC transporter ATP-binding protein [Methylobacterium sp.]MCZ8270310.1 ABC transporter ATP-binding protein [Beijerinckiaceae bacterium]MCA3648181.1 ABC transporter ATP-binding protein [Methylobacterium sp.]MCA3655512.1 ABC transporter ATP-binding protein [Methylobacterium sp.]MCA3657312.1 ABC transporter ATP-binding protein [Methylobacterium sp.]